MPYESLARFVLLPELSLVENKLVHPATNVYVATKDRPRFEICPRCATQATAYYDKRTVKLHDEPLRNAQVRLVVHKHRWWCKKCKKPFTEPIAGVMPGRRTTQRFRRSLKQACEDFTDLSRVRRTYRCSTALVYKILYEQLELKWREYQYNWPKKVGIDEHFFRRYNGSPQFATVLTDLTNRRLKEICFGKRSDEIIPQILHVQGRYGVELVSMDLAESYRKFSLNFFPSARIVADKFHVLRLLSPHLLKERRAISGKNITGLGRRVLLGPSWKLDYFEKRAFWEKLKEYPKLNELYWWKERLHNLYRIKGVRRATIAIDAMLDQMKGSSLREIQTLRRTLISWKEEILNYFQYRITNATTEGFNNVAKVVQRRAFGYKNFRNYRLRVLSACA